MVSPPQISDHYKLMVLLPRLTIFNGKNVSSTASHLRYAYTENLRTRVRFHSSEMNECLRLNEISSKASALLWRSITEGAVHRSSGSFCKSSPSFQISAVWERSFRLPDPVTVEMMAALEESFVNAARQQVKFGPSSVSDFTKWRVTSSTSSRSFVPPPQRVEVVVSTSG